MDIRLFRFPEAEAKANVNVILYVPGHFLSFSVTFPLKTEYILMCAGQHVSNENILHLSARMNSTLLYTDMFFYFHEITHINILKN